jgi:hypothetical protein
METFSWHPGWRSRYAFLAVVSVTCLMVWWLLPGDQERGLALWGLLLPALGMIEGVATVDTGRRVLIRRWRLWEFTVVRREMPLDGFEAVTLRGIKDPWPGDPGYLVMVRKDGRFVKVSYFSGSSVRDGVAKEAAVRLSRATGLPLADYPVRGYTRPLFAGD